MDSAHDFDPSQYVQPNGPEAEKFKDGAEVIYCKECQAPLLIPAGSTIRDCGRHTV